MMRLLLGLALVLVAGSAHAQFGPPLFVSGVTTPAYTGIADIAGTPLVFWGLRAMSSADRGNDLIDISRTSDSTTCTHIKSSSTTGLVDLTVATPCGGATVTSFCNATTCNVTKLYNRGNNAQNFDAVKNSANNPTLSLSCVNSNPCIQFSNSGSTCLYNVVNSLGRNQPYSIYNIAERTGNLTSALNVSGGTGGGSARIGYTTSNNTARMQVTSTISATASDNTWHALLGLFNGSSSSLAVDSSAAVTGTVEAVGVGGYGVGCAAAAGGFTGNWVEFAFWGSDITSNQSTLSSNAKTFWGY